MDDIRQTVLCLIFILLTGKLWSQNPFAEKTFGTIYNESCFSFIHTSDNGYALVGGTSAPGAGGVLDIYFSKLDSNENLLWTKTYGGAGNEVGNCIRQTLDGGYIMSGEQTSFGSGGSDGYLIRTDSQGTILWSKAYGLSQNDAFGKVELTSDSNYIIAGTTYSTGSNSGDILVVKVNDSGDTLWTRIIGGPVYDSGINLTPTDDGGCTICGRVYSYGAGLRDVMLSRIDGNGNVLWFKTYGGIFTEEGMAVTHTSDNGYVITGATESFSGNIFYDVYMIKTDSIGDLIWSKTYGGDKVDATYCVIEAPDGGYVVTGFTDSWAYLHLRPNDPLTILGDDSSHVFFMKVNVLGDTVWARAIGGTTVDEAYALINAPDGGYIIGAYSNSFSSNDSLDAYIIHTDSLGVSGCHTYFISPHIGNPNTIVNSYTPTVITGLIITNSPTIEDTVTFLQSDPCLGVSVEENNLVQTMGILFPNPFSTSAVIILPEGYNVPVNVTIYDIFGKKTGTETISPLTREIKIERKNLPDGIYFIEINSAVKNIFRSKMILTGKQ
ncbi:MAG TPA: T9SS type A sorting domain-containing protein [Bacteroidia bacterium]|nr:T9SS type A sorting domain-containing protein [Bacteroidia bacterium]